jgi:aldehyde:ferredoxin oxidoreductase
MSGFEGKIVEVNLTTGAVKKFNVPQEVLRKFMGGSGLGAKLFFDAVSPDVDPLSGDNTLFFTTGPLTGTNIPGGARSSACFKSPLTNIWGESNCGGNFGPELRYAGYDGIAIKGASSKPVYLLIDDDRVEIKDAVDLWGKDTYETVDILKQTIGGTRKAAVLAIGQAGENLVKYAAIVNDKYAKFGRCGGGAVMGSKKLKAIAVRGTSKLEFAEPAEFQKRRKEIADKSKEHIATQFMKDHGTNGGMMVLAATGDLPGKNWSLGDNNEVASKVNGVTVTENYLVSTHSCYGCPNGCKRMVKVKEGPYKVDESPGPEYETAASFGTLLMVDDLPGLIKANELCNRYGLDTISCGSTIAFAMDCFENGIINNKDTDSIDLSWGNIQAVLELVGKIARREGFGDTLAEGSRKAAQKIGKNAADYAVEVKGLEVPMHDPRAGHGLGLAYATSIRGACHMSNLNTSIEMNTVVAPEIGLTGTYEGMKSEGKAEMTLISENLAAVCNAAILCNIAVIPWAIQDIVDMLRLTSGFDYDIKEMMECGERIWLLKRGLNNLMGVKSSDDRLPKRILTPTKEGTAAGSVPDIDLMLKEYYGLRGLDSEGRPLKAKLNSVGLADLAARL